MRRAIRLLVGAVLLAASALAFYGGSSLYGASVETARGWVFARALPAETIIRPEDVEEQVLPRRLAEHLEPNPVGKITTGRTYQGEPAFRGLVEDPVRYRSAAADQAALTLPRGTVDEYPWQAGQRLALYLVDDTGVHLLAVGRVIRPPAQDRSTGVVVAVPQEAVESVLQGLRTVKANKGALVPVAPAPEVGR